MDSVFEIGRVMNRYEKAVVWLCVLFFLFMGWKNLAIHMSKRPIKMTHFAPQLTKKIPLLKKLDMWACASLGIEWYKVKHKTNGRVYLLKTGWLIHDKIMEKTYFVMDDIKRDKWIELSSEQFMSRFGDIYESAEGYTEANDEAPMAKKV